MNLIKKLHVVMIVTASAIWAWASPWSLPVKAAVEKAGAHAGGHAACEAVARGGAALAKATAMREAEKAAARATAAKVAEKATPGKILAAGAGAALVVGAHEVSDGIQEMGKGVGKAVEDNPAVAAELGREILSLPKTVAGILAVFAMAVLAWLLWPFLSLARNCIRLAAARKERMLEAVPAAQDAKPDSGGLGAPGFARIRLVWALAFLLLSALGVWRLSVGGDSVRTQRKASPQGVDAGSRMADRAKAVDCLRREYEAEVTRIHGEFLAKVDSTAGAEFGRVRAGIPKVVKQFGTISRCFALVKTVALDKLRGGDRTGNGIRQDLEVSYYSGLYAARDGVAGCLHDLASNLENARRAFAVQLKAELASGELPGDGEYKAMLEECGERIEKSKRDLAVGQVVAGVSVAVEAVCIRQTVAVVSSLLGKTAARQAGTMAAGAAAAIADGPIPLGDIIGGVAVLGCTVWTIADVREAAKVLPAELAKTLDGVTRDCERQCREEVLKAGGRLVDAALSTVRYGMSDKTSLRRRMHSDGRLKPAKRAVCRQNIFATPIEHWLKYGTASVVAHAERQLAAGPRKRTSTNFRFLFSWRRI